MLVSHGSPQLPASLHKTTEQTVRIFPASGPLGVALICKHIFESQALFKQTANRETCRAWCARSLKVWEPGSWLGVSVERLYDSVDNTPVATHNELKDLAERQKAELDANNLTSRYAISHLSF